MISDKFKGLIFFLMVIFSFSMLSFGNDEPINTNVGLWVLFALLNLFYWGFKCMFMVFKILFGVDNETSAIYSNRNYKRHTNTNTNDNNIWNTEYYNSVPDEHHRYLPKKTDNTSLKDICDSVKVQNGITIHSIKKK